MPIFVDPGIANPAPPEVVTSPDGILTATVHGDGGGVFLEADFTFYPSTPGRQLEVLRTNVARPIKDPALWAAGGGATNTLSSEWAAYGAQSIKVTPAGTITSAVYPYGVINSLNGMRPGHTYTVSATVRLAQVQSGDLHNAPRAILVANVDAAGTVDLGHAVSESAPNEIGEHPVSVTFTVPADSVGVYFRLMNGSTSTPVWWDGFMIEEGETASDYFDGDTPSPGDPDQPHYRWARNGGSEEFLPALAPVRPPQRVRFERADLDGVWEPIFSGDPASAPGGYGVAYDMFAPLGAPITYRAVPIFYDGTEGTPSEALAVVLRHPAKWGNRRRVTWLKSARDPGASMRVLATGEPPQFSREGRVSLHAVPGTPIPAGSSDVQQSRTFTMSFLTEDRPEREQMERLLTSGTLLLQTPLGWQLGDMWVEPGTVTMTPHARMDTGAHVWSVEFTQVGQPSTADTPLVVPGRSWQWAADTHTWSSLNATYATWLDVIKPAAGAA